MGWSKIVLVPVFCFSVGAMAGLRAPAVGAVLAEARVSSGGSAWNRIHALQLFMQIRSAGLRGIGHEEIDLTTGAYVGHFRLAHRTESVGFDGHTAWVKGMDGDVTSVDAPASRARAITEAYLNSYGYWYPQRRHARIRMVGIEVWHGTAYTVVQVTPEGGAPAELWFDATTRLLRRTVVPSSFGVTSTVFSDYRTVGGVKLPFRSRQVQPHGNGVAMRIRVVKVNPPILNAFFSVPKQSFSDIEVAHNAASATIPFKLINNHIYIQASINHRPVQLLVDTGGANMVTPAVAKALGLKGRGDIQGHGVGKKTVKVQVTTVKQLGLGSKVTLRSQLFYIVPLTGLHAAEGTEVSGLVGFQVFNRFVVRINYARRMLTLIRSNRFDPHGAGKAIAFTFSGHDPQVAASLDRVKGEFTIDTGSRGPLTLWAPFVRRHKLLKQYKTTPLTVVGWGIGGSASARVTRARILTLGPIAVEGPVVELETSDVGAAGNHDVAGNIGGAILKRFTVTFDYADKLIYLEPNSDALVPMHYDRSGMWINQAKDGFKVKFVVPGGPSATAGLKAGDLITGVDGRPASRLRLYRVRKMLRDKPSGSLIQLTVGVGEHRHDVTLVLRRQIPKLRNLPNGHEWKP